MKKMVKQPEYGILISWGDTSDPQIPSTSKFIFFEICNLYFNFQKFSKKMWSLATHVMGNFVDFALTVSEIIENLWVFFGQN